MAATVFNRMFQLWAYTVSHSQLLLRSTKSENRPTRVDILFKDVVAMRLPSFFEDLILSEVAADEVGLSAASLQGRSVWRLKGSAFDGYVVAGAMAIHEDGGEYDDPSAIYPS